MRDRVRLYEPPAEDGSGDVRGVVPFGNVLALLVPLGLVAGLIGVVSWLTR